MRLRWVPEMRAAAGKPDVDVRVRVGIVTGDAHYAGIVFLGLRDTIEERAELHGNDLGAHAELFQIVLKERCHFGAVGIGGTGEDAEFHGLAVRILKRGFAVRSCAPGKPGFLEKRSGPLERAWRVRKICVAPTLVARCHQSPDCSAAALVDEADYCFAVRCS